MDSSNKTPRSKKALGFWMLATCGVWFVWIVSKANQAHDRAAVELSHKTGLGHWWHSNDPDTAFNNTIAMGLVGVLIPIFAAIVITAIQDTIMDEAGATLKKQQAKRDQRDFAEQMETMETQHAVQTDLSKLAHSKQELIVRLGSIDQYIRVLGIETDLSKRTVALQAAHSEMTTLASKIASGQISREAAEDLEVCQQAAETSNDLARIGLADDRLNRDLFRIFNLTRVET